MFTLNGLIQTIIFATPEANLVEFLTATKLNF